MARDPEPMTDEEIDALRGELHEQREEIRDYLDGEGVDVRAWDDAPARDHGDAVDEARPDGGRD